MKHISILLIICIFSINTFAQVEVKHPKRPDKVIILKADGTWQYKADFSTMKDVRDNKTYQTVTIGEQTWMAENLAFKPNSGKYWYLDNEEKNIQKFGYLYDWETAKNVCPSGWHLPSDEEYKQMEIYLGLTQEEADDTRSRGSCGKGGVGRKLKSIDWRYCNSQINKGTNESGFNALAGGEYYDRGSKFLKEDFHCWTNTGYDNSMAWIRILEACSAQTNRIQSSKKNGLNVRCIKD